MNSFRYLKHHTMDDMDIDHIQYNMRKRIPVIFLFYFILFFPFVPCIYSLSDYWHMFKANRPLLCTLGRYGCFKTSYCFHPTRYRSLESFMPRRHGCRHMGTIGLTWPPTCQEPWEKFLSYAKRSPRRRDGKHYLYFCFWESGKWNEIKNQDMSTNNTSNRTTVTKSTMKI